jgi:hypothetical protein
MSELLTIGRLIALSLNSILVIPLKKFAFGICMGDLRNDNFVVQTRRAKKSWLVQKHDCSSTVSNTLTC